MLLKFKAFFDIPVDNLYAESLLVRYINDRIPGRPSEKILVSPDAGGVKRAKSVADRVGTEIAIIHKERYVANQVEKMTLVGDVNAKVAILVDDLADTCGTLVLAAKTLMEKGATSVYALVTHGVLSGDAVKKIETSDIVELVITNSIAQTQETKNCKKIKVIDLAPTLAEAIRRTHNGESISVLFTDPP